MRQGTRRVCLFAPRLERYKSPRATLSFPHSTQLELANTSNSQLHSHDLPLPHRTRCSAALQRAHRRLSPSPRAHPRSLPYTTSWRHSITLRLFCITISGTGRPCLSGQQLASLWLLRRLGVFPARLRRLLCARCSRPPAADSSAGLRVHTRAVSASILRQLVWNTLPHPYHRRRPRRHVLHLYDLGHRLCSFLLLRRRHPRPATT